MDAIDNTIATLEKLLFPGDWPTLEKKYVDVFTFYLIHEEGRFFYRSMKSNPEPLMTASRSKKERAVKKLLSFFKLVIRKHKEKKDNK